VSRLTLVSSWHRFRACRLSLADASDGSNYDTLSVCEEESYKIKLEG
jgi:hypothetical protein